MAVINKPAQPLIAPTDVEEVEAIAGAAAADAIASDTTHAPLVNDLVPAAHLPSYVDDVLEFENLDAFPEEGEEGKIYVARDTNNTYRWADTTYVQVGGSEIDLTPYALKTEVAAALDTIADEVDNKQDKIYQIMLSDPTTREPTEHGAHMAGSLTADQIAEAREYYPNITVGLDENSTLGLPTSAATDGETGRLEEAAWNRVQYEVFLEPSKKVLCYITIELDLKAATYDMWMETIPIEAEGGDGVPTIILDTDATSGTLNAEQLAIVKNNTNVLIDIAAIDETLRGPSTIYRSYYCDSGTMKAIASDPDNAKVFTVNRNTGEWTVTAASASVSSEAVADAMSELEATDDDIDSLFDY